MRDRLLQTVLLGSVKSVRATPAWFWLLMVSSLASLVLLWPLPVQLATRTLDPADALQQAWTIRWLQETLLTRPGRLFNMPSTYPFPVALVLYQPIYSTALLGLPLYLAGLSPVAVANSLLLLNFILTCWIVALLGRQLSGSTLAGLVAGLLYTFSSVRLAHLVHLNLLTGFWGIAVLLLLLSFWRRPPATWRGLLGMALVLGCLGTAQVLGDFYNGFQLLTMLVVWGLYQLLTRRWGLAWRQSLALAGSGLLALLLSLLLLLPTLAGWQQLGLRRQLEDHQHHAAWLEDYITPAYASTLGYDLGRYRSPYSASGGAEHTLWPGLVTLALALAGVLAARRAQRQEQGFLLLLLALAFFLSLGPTIRWSAGDTGVESLAYRWLYQHLPLFSALRAASRWGLVVQLCLALLGAYGSAALLRWLRRLAPRWRVLAPPAGGLLLLLALLDSWPPPVRGGPQIVGEPAPQVYDALRRLPEGPLLEWPMENADHNLAHRYVFYTLQHRHPIVNANGSILPQRYLELQRALRRFPDASTLSLLRGLGVRYVNVNRWELGGWQTLERRLQATPGLRLLGSYEQGRHYLYELLPSQPPAPGVPIADLIRDTQGLSLSLQLVAPLWLDLTANYYDPPQPVTITLYDQHGRAQPSEQVLPPVLLPGTYLLALPPAGGSAVALQLGDQHIPIGADPTLLVERLSSGPQLLADLPVRAATAGQTLPCRLYGKGPMALSPLALSINLVDVHGRIITTQDHLFADGLPSPERWPADSFTPVSCQLPLPTELPGGIYFLAIGLFDPQAGQGVPFAGPDSTVVPGFWLVPQPITVQPATG